MFTVLFSGTSYNRLGVSLFLVLGKPSGPRPSEQGNVSSKSNPEPKSAIQTSDLNLSSGRIRIPKYWDEEWSPNFEQQMELALNRVSLEVLIRHIKEFIETGERYLTYCQNNYRNIETDLGNYAGSYIRLLSSVTQLRVIVENEQRKTQMPNELIKQAEALIDRATPVLWFMGPLANISGLKHCLDRLRDKGTEDDDVIRYINNAKEYLVIFGKKCERLQEFLKSSPQLTEDLQNMAKEMLAKAQNMFEDLQKFLREEIGAITSSRPALAVMLLRESMSELIGSTLPNLLENNKEIIENIGNLLGLTTKVTESSKEDWNKQVITQPLIASLLSRLKRDKKPPQR